MNTTSNKWTIRFLKLALHIADWSKDPSTKVGAVIAKGNRVISFGFNGFPQGVIDSLDRLNDREFKYPAIIHAEENALLFSNTDLTDCIIYTSVPPCARCTSKIIQKHIKKIITIPPKGAYIDRWDKDRQIANQLRKEAGIIYIEVDI